MSDIRKWFMKQPHKPSTNTDAPVVDTSKQDHASEGVNTERKKVSKYFASSTPEKRIKPSIEKEPTPEKVATKTKKQKVDKGDVSGFKVSPSKKVQSVSPSKRVQTVSPSKKVQTEDTKGECIDRSTLGGSGIGSRASAENQNESPPQHAGRGGGGGGGRSGGGGGGRSGGGGGGRGGTGRGGGRGGYGNFADRGPPPHKGEKEIPEGAEDCLQGLTFVISGTLDSLEREEAEDLIKRHGGRVTTSVSKKTSYLLADEDIGGRKSEKAKEHGTPFLSEDGLFDMIRKSKPEKPSGKQDVLKKDHKDTKAIETKCDKDVKSKAGAKGKISKAYCGMKSENHVQSEAPCKKMIRSVEGNIEIWTEKYRPKTPNDLIGNQSIVKQLHDWLVHWDEHHLHTEAKGNKGKKHGSGGGSSDASKKAVLLSGTPGIGKTTTARLITQMLGFTPIEVNASDNRGKADSKIERGVGGSTANSIKELISNEALNFGHSKGLKHQKFALIMDEVDGMSGGDRGGVTDLIANIKMSKIPIICICNDRYSQKLKSLVNHCLLLNFRKPTKQQMAKRLHQIAELEGLKVDEIALEELGERVNGDMRMAINQLQYMNLSASVLKYADIKASLQRNGKDEDVTPFTAVDKLLGYEGGRLRIDERMDLSMADSDLIPLLIQENYLNYKPSAASRDTDGTLRMDLIARAAESIADGDIVNVQIRRYRQWQHSQMGAFASSIIPASYMHGQREVLLQGERNFNRFGAWLGKNSTLGKNVRLLEDIHVHVLASRTSEPTRQSLRMDYLPIFMLRLTNPLRTLPKEEAVQTVVEFMDEYSFNQEDSETIVDLCKFQGHPDPFDGVPPAFKAALTKAYKQNEQSRCVRSADLLPSISYPGQKKTPKSKRVASLLTEVEDGDSLQNEDVLEEEEEDNEDDLEASALKDGNLHLSLEENKPKGVEIQLDIKNKDMSSGNASKGKQSTTRTVKGKSTPATRGVKRKR